MIPCIEVLESYDRNDDGVIEDYEMRGAVEDYDAGRITKDSLDCVTEYYEAGINKDIMTVLIPFAVAAVVMYVVVKMIWR